MPVRFLQGPRFFRSSGKISSTLAALPALVVIKARSMSDTREGTKIGLSGGEADMVFGNSLLTLWHAFLVGLALEVLSSVTAMAFGVTLGAMC